MRCVKCFTNWTDIDDLILHLIAHGADDWTIQNACDAYKVQSFDRWAGHTLETCRCRYKGPALECELWRPR